MSKPVVGEIFTVPYPFVRDVYVDHDYDGEGWQEIERPTWKPGTRIETHARYCGHGEYDEYSQCAADGMGSQILTVVGVYQPPSYPTRVFFTRCWRDPDGKEFGKVGKLRILAVSAFVALTRGYRHRFFMSEPATKVDAVDPHVDSE